MAQKSQLNISLDMMIMSLDDIPLVFVHVLQTYFYIYFFHVFFLIRSFIR